MMKLEIIGDSYALISGNGEPGEDGTLTLHLNREDRIASLSVNGRSYPVSGKVFRVPVTAFATGPNRLALRFADGRVVPSEGIRLTGGIFFPQGAGIADVIAACDKRFAALDAALIKLAARVRSLEEDSGILP